MTGSPAFSDFPVHLELRNVSKVFGSGNGTVVALDDVNLSAAGREFVSIVGPSGCGKTTILRMLAGLTEPTSGSISLAPEPKPDRLRTALVFQDHALLPWRTIEENVVLGRTFLSGDRATTRKDARRILERMGLSRFLDRKPHELSIGMQQRVGLARAILSDPEILLLDEPFGALDAQTRLLLQDELLRLWAGHRGIFMLVTHDLDEAIYLSDRIYVLSGRPGRVLLNIPVPLARPRRREQLADPGISKVREQIWGVLREEVRAQLAMTEDL